MFSLTLLPTTYYVLSGLPTTIATDYYLLALLHILAYYVLTLLT